MKGLHLLSETQRFERFISFSDKGCWIWKGGVTCGYGMFRFKWKMTRAHRKSYELYKGAIPDGSVVMHKCDNPLCVNPDHLEVGTITDNNQDRKRKGRNRDQRGIKHNNAKLCEISIHVIKDAVSHGYKQQEIADYFKVSFQHVSAIKLGKRWKHKIVC